MINILPVEDDPIIGRGLEINLKEGIITYLKKTLKEAIYQKPITFQISSFLI